MTTVAEEGNKRRGAASVEEIEQCILDIKSWFERNTPLEVEKATSIDFQRCEKTIDMSIPRSLKIILSEANGGLWLMDKPLLSLNGIAELLSSVQSSRKWNGNLFPFAGDESGMLVLDTASGEVCEWDSDDGLGSAVSASLTAFFENYRDSLLESHCEFLRDVGVVEKVGGKGQSRGK